MARMKDEITKITEGDRSRWIESEIQRLSEIEPSNTSEGLARFTVGETLELLIEAREILREDTPR